MSITLQLAPPPPISGFDDLVTAIAAYLDRGDLNDRIPTFIQLAEDEFNDTIRSGDMETEATFTINADASDFTLPDDLLELRNVILLTNPEVVLEQVTPAERRRRTAQAPTRPETYSLQGNAMRFGPQPDGAYDVTIEYYALIPAISVDVQSNWLLKRRASLYLFTALMHAESFLNNDPRVSLWAAAKDDAMSKLQAQLNRKRYGAQPLRLRPSVCV